jgi:multidrug resistance efflux pump
MTKRTFEISLPHFTWQKIVLILSTVTLLASGLYWWKAVRPFYHIEHAMLQAPILQIQAVESGIIASCSLEEGERFKAGQPLFSFDSEILSAELSQINANLDSCQQRIQQEKFKLEQAMQKYVRAQGELEIGIGSSGEMDRVLSEVEDAQKKSDQYETEISFLAAEKSSVQAKIAKQLFAAPFEGMVIRRYMQPGEIAKAGDPILAICNQQLRWVETEIPEQMLANIRVGLSAILAFPSYPGKKWPAKVSWISPIVNEGKMKIRLTAERLPDQHGLSANVSIKVH